MCPASDTLGVVGTSKRRIHDLGRPIVGVCIYLIGSPWASKRKAHFIHSHRSASAAMVHKAQTRKPISAPSMSDARGIEIETGKPRRRR
jgi:hypothetical protein